MYFCQQILVHLFILTHIYYLYMLDYCLYVLPYSVCLRNTCILRVRIEVVKYSFLGRTDIITVKQTIQGP